MTVQIPAAKRYAWIQRRGSLPYLLYLNKCSLDLLNNLLTQDKQYYMPNFLSELKKNFFKDLFFLEKLG